MVTFTRRAQSYTDATDVTTEAVTTITGNAIQVRGDPRRYKALNLVLTTMPTLFFSPTTYTARAGTDEFIQPGDTVVWATKTYTVKDVDPIAPDGVVIAARVVIGL